LTGPTPLEEVVLVVLELVVLVLVVVELQVLELQVVDVYPLIGPTPLLEVVQSFQSAHSGAPQGAISFGLPQSVQPNGSLPPSSGETPWSHPLGNPGKW
jgi:hypothetical protein